MKPHFWIAIFWNSDMFSKNKNWIKYIVHLNFLYKFGRIQHVTSFFLYHPMRKCSKLWKYNFRLQKTTKIVINVILEKFRLILWKFNSSFSIRMRLEESTVKTVFFFTLFMWKLNNYENTVLDYKKRSKHAINIIFEKFRSSFYGSSNLYFLFLMRIALGGSTLKRSFFL